MLDKFSNAEKAEARKRKKMDRTEKKRTEAFLRNKLVASSLLNRAMTADEASRFRDMWSGDCKVPLDQLNNVLLWEDFAEVTGYTPYEAPSDYVCGDDDSLDAVGLSAVTDYFYAVEHCRTWFQQRLSELGYKCSAWPEYDPVQVSDSVSQLLFSYMELVKLHAKLLQRYFEYTKL